MKASRSILSRLVTAVVALGVNACGGRSGAILPALAAEDTSAGKIVLVDAGHHNLGSLDDIFATWLAEHDFELRTVSGPFDESTLSGAHVLVIRNPTHASNVGNYARPIRSAFSQAEIRAVVSWVEGGGGLFLIIEHMPWAGAMSELAAAFGVTLTDGFVVRGGALPQVIPTLTDSSAGAFGFRRADGGLSSHPVTRAVDSVFTYWGTAFRLPRAGSSLLTLDSAALSLEPDVAWQFPKGTPTISVGGWSQAAYYAAGRRSGREAATAEAALEALGEWEECLLWVTVVGVWPSSEDWPTYYAFRGQRGERRSLTVVPGHWVAAGERDALRELLTLVLENAWDAYVLPASGGRATGRRLFVSHDEFVDVHADGPVELRVSAV